MVMQGCATVRSHQRHRCSINPFVEIVMMVIRSTVYVGSDNISDSLMLSIVAMVPLSYRRPSVPLLQCLLLLQGSKSSCLYGRRSQYLDLSDASIGCSASRRIHAPALPRLRPLLSLLLNAVLAVSAKFDGYRFHQLRYVSTWNHIMRDMLFVQPNKTVAT